MERKHHQTPNLGGETPVIRKPRNSNSSAHNVDPAVKSHYRRRMSNVTNSVSPAQSNNNNADDLHLVDVENDRKRNSVLDNSSMINSMSKALSFKSTNANRKPDSNGSTNTTSHKSVNATLSRHNSKINNGDNAHRTSVYNAATSKKAALIVSKKPSFVRQLSKKSNASISKKHQSTMHLTSAKRQRSGKFQKNNLIIRFLKIFGILYQDVELIDPEAIEAVHALGLTQSHLRKLKLKFNNIDIDGSGTIDADEFLESFGEKNSPFTAYLFTLIDVDGSGTIEFDEYIRVLATYCMYSKDEILRFCFSCFDVDGSGSIDEREFVELCKSVNNAAPAFPENFRRALDEFDADHDGLIDYNEFVELDRRFPLILFPAFRLQDLMQRHTLGELTWLQIMTNYSKRKTIAQYKELHGGEGPPMPIWERIAKKIFPRWFKDEPFMELGEAFENRQKENREARKAAAGINKSKSSVSTPSSRHSTGKSKKKS